MGCTSKFGGFLNGNKYNWIVFGQDNTEKNNEKEIIRIVKYDKQFNKLASVSLNGKQTYTTIPFDAGTLRMAESPTELAIASSRERYDGHQSNLSIILDIETMKIKNSIGSFPANHVSHSFNQFVKYNNKDYEYSWHSDWVFLEHGDAYPRGIALNKQVKRTETGKDMYGNKKEVLLQDYREQNIFPVTGGLGVNTTGINIGGFEVTNTGYLTAINSVNMSDVEEFTTYSIKFKTAKTQERDIILIYVDENGTIKQNKITNYFGKGTTVSIPKLLKINNNKYMVLWQEIRQNSSSLKYTFVNEKGDLIDKIYDKPNLRMSSTEPIILNNYVVLPTASASENKVTLYRIPLK